MPGQVSVGDQVNIAENVYKMDKVRRTHVWMVCWGVDGSSCVPLAQLYHYCVPVSIFESFIIIIF